MTSWVLAVEGKLVARNAEAAIKVETGMKGVKIMNLMVSGGTEAKNIGIHFVGATDNGMLSNIIGINLHTGVKIEQAKKYADSQLLGMRTP